MTSKEKQLLAEQYTANIFENVKHIFEYNSDYEVDASLCREISMYVAIEVANALEKADKVDLEVWKFVKQDLEQYYN